jgi:hypothetical protein
MDLHEKIHTELVCEVPNANLRIWLDGNTWSGFAVIFDPKTGNNQIVYFSSGSEESAKLQALQLASYETAEWRPAKLTISPLMRSAAAGAGGGRTFQ